MLVGVHAIKLCLFVASCKSPSGCGNRAFLPTKGVAEQARTTWKVSLLWQRTFEPTKFYQKGTNGRLFID